MNHYGDFKLDYPDRQKQERYLSRATYPSASLLECEFDIDGRIVKIYNDHDTSILFDGDAPAPEQWSAIDWSKVEGFTHLKELVLTYIGIEGSIAFNKLPRSLKRLDLHKNQLGGLIDFRGLPPGLTDITLHMNQYSGKIDFDPLRDCCLQYLFLDFNKFTAVENGQSLPPTLVRMDLRTNDFDPPMRPSSFAQQLLRGTSLTRRVIIHY